MADGQETPSARRGQRPPAPHLDGPLGSSGAAPADEPSATDGSDDRAAKTTGSAPASDSPAVGEPEQASDAPPAATGDASGDDRTPNPATDTTTPVSDAEAPDTRLAKTAGKEAAGKGTKGEATAAEPSAGETAGGTASSGEDKSSPEKTSPESGQEKTSPEPGQEKSGQEKTSPEPGQEKSGQENDGKDGAGEKAAPTAAAVAAASKGRTTRVLRAANPVRVARNTARSTSAWAKRPSGRLILPAVIAALLLGAAGTAGAYLVPQALQAVPTPSVTPGFGQDAGASAGPVVAPSISGVPGLPGSVSAPVVGGTLPGAPPTVAGLGNARPADALSAWAQQAGTRAGIPVVAAQAYGYAELVVARATPTCHLTWTTIAAIAKVESSHGSANGAVLSVDGSVAPAIFGLPLDGKGGRQLIRDSDQGALDGDAQFDRAMGPLQFIPQTWTAISAGNGVDADNNGISDPNDIDDASLAAARYLCQGGRDLSKPDAWWDAILSYNAVRPYAQKVFDAANDYGQRSRV
ncbi:murein transglycosylase [Actinoplanes sp. NPDC049118]|uniref:murein transglycosylase n=1 Tax=Actinoplanes sp. NPDC049118 TaxID=3155769 RepID=UPI003402E4BD